VTVQTEPTPKKTRAKKDESKAGNGQGSVYQLANGKWRWQVHLGYINGKRQRATGVCDNLTLAEHAKARAVADFTRGLLGASEKITVKEYGERWLSRQKGLETNSLLAYRTELNYALEHLGKMKVKSIKPHHIKDTLLALSERKMESGKAKGKPMSSRTLGKVRTRLKAMFREAVSDGLIYVNPCDGVKRVKGHESESVGFALDEVQMTRLHELGLALWDAGVCRLFPAIFTAVSLGLRRGEVFGLRWQDVDFQKNVLRIRQNLKTPGGKPVLGELKTRHSKRDIPMPLSLKNILLVHQEKQKLERERAETYWTDTGAVFATEYGYHTDPSNLNRALTNLCEWSDESTLTAKKLLAIPVEKRARLELIITAGERLPDMTPHDLRHTAATLMLKRKTPVEVVSRILGHAKVSITMDVYRHVLDSEKHTAMPDLFDMPLPERQAQAKALN
jgi:integrase